MPRILCLGLAALGLLAAAGTALAQQPASILGPWLSENREGVVDIYRCADRLCGRTVWMKQPLDVNGKPMVDRRNPKPELRARPICGLTILGDFRPKGPDEWGGGWVYSPAKGKSYDASMRLASEGVLKLRVGGALIGETQTWTRADPKLANCPGG